MPNDTLDPAAKEFYCHTLSVFEKAELPVLIGGAYAFGRYTGIERHTKDFDVFVREEHFLSTLRALDQAGYATDTPFPHWLGKAYHGDFFVDVIFGSGNGIVVMPFATFNNRVDWTASTGTVTVFYNPTSYTSPTNFTTR